MIVPVMLAVLWLLIVWGAQAAQEVNESGKASADGQVVIENLAGSIKVIGWDKKEVQVEGTLSDDVEELKFKPGKKRTIIEVVYPRHSKNIRKGADLVIKVPEGSSLEVECVSADITTSKLKGELELSSISGRVEFTGWCGELELSSISGNIMVDGGADEMSLESISGLVEARGQEAEINADSVSGDIFLEYDKFLSLSSESVSGNIKVIGDLDSRGRFSCDVVNGTITMVVPGNVNAEFEISTFNGNIDNDFGQKAHRTSKYAPGKELEFTNGDGDAEVELNSFNGNVKIRKK